MQEVSTVSTVKKTCGKFSHRIVGWSGLQRHVGAHIESPMVELCDRRWLLRVFPGGSAPKHKQFVSIYLANRSNSVVMASYTLYCMNQIAGKEHKSFKSSGIKVFETQGQGKIDGWGRDRFIGTHELENEDDGFCVNDTVVFAVEITVFGELEHQYLAQSKGHTLDQDLKALLVTNKNADMCLWLDNRTVQMNCHRCILAARSPVFQAMLSHDTAERASGEVCLEEDSVVVKIFLDFLYTDSCDDETMNDYGTHLLAMGCKYQVPLLVSLCESYFAKSVNCDNVISLYLLADLYCLERLAKVANEFIRRNYEMIETKEDYRNLSDQLKSDIVKFVMTNDKRFKYVSNPDGTTQIKKANGKKWNSVCIIM